ncbi:MAG: elongation factor P maturation arginine rhamnosyltransferase EarP, partial [Caldimonas sp.]
DDLAWLASLGAATRPGERRVFVFCYENLALAALLDGLAAEPTLLLVAPGAAAQQVAAALGPTRVRGALRAVDVPFLSQPDFDRLLAMCELNLVRGEDSFVRAIWAGAPFLWQLYPQDDGAHAAKLDAFLDRFLVGASLPLQRSLRDLFRRWNGIGGTDGAMTDLGPTALAEWHRHCIEWRDRLVAQDDLVTRLIDFVTSRR